MDTRADSVAVSVFSVQFGGRFDILGPIRYSYVPLAIPGRIVWPQPPGSSDMHQQNRKILQIHTNSLFFSY